MINEVDFITTVLRFVGVVVIGARRKQVVFRNVQVQEILERKVVTDYEELETVCSKPLGRELKGLVSVVVGVVSGDV